MQPFTFPPLEQVKERMGAMWPTPTYPRWILPESMQGHPQCESNFGDEANNPDLGNAPPDWMLRPERELTQQQLVDTIAELPRTDDPVGNGRDNGWRDFPDPECKDPDGIHACYLAPSREDNVVENGEIVGMSSREWTYRGRIITMRDSDTWSISGTTENMSHRFRRTPTNPTMEWWLENEVQDQPASPLVHQRHPDLQRQDPNLKPQDRLGEWGVFEITSSGVYGYAWIALKRLGFMGGLDVAINYIECLDWALGIAGRPAWLDGDHGPQQAPALPAAETQEIGPEDVGTMPPPDDEADELQQVLERVTAARKGAKGNLVEVRKARADATDLRRQAEAAERAADLAEAQAAPQRQALRDGAARLVELLKADEDFPEIQ